MDGSHSEFVFVENQREGTSPEPVDGWTVVQFAPDDAAAKPTTTTEQEDEEDGHQHQNAAEEVARTEAALPHNDEPEPEPAVESAADRRAAEAQQLEAERQRVANERAQQEADEHKRRLQEVEDEEQRLHAIYLSRRAQEIGEDEQRKREEALVQQAIRESEEMAAMRKLQEDLDAVSAMRLVESPASLGSDSGQLRAADRQMEELEQYRRLQKELDEISRNRLQEKDSDAVIENLRRLQRELDEYSAQRFKEDNRPAPPPPVDSEGLFRSASSQPASVRGQCFCLGASKGFHRRDCPMSTQ